VFGNKPRASIDRRFGAIRKGAVTSAMTADGGMPGAGRCDPGHDRRRGDAGRKGAVTSARTADGGTLGAGRCGRQSERRT
jgi:hypothetical protein